MRQDSSSKHTRKVTKYLEKIVINYALINYKIVDFYEKALRQRLPKIAEALNKIKRLKYNFLFAA